MSDTAPYFDEQGAPVAVTLPDFGDDEPPDDALAARLEAISRLLAFLVDGAPSPDAVGKRVLLLAFVTGASPFRSQRELAAHLDVSEARISQAVKSLRSKLRSQLDD